jgi:putative chromate ion transporter
VFLEFLKLGSIVFGSGYVLVSYLHNDLVLGNHWLTESQLLATVAIGQVTPGPVFTTATAIGYVVGGVPAPLLATLAIFLPSFVFVAALMPLLSRARRSSWSAAALDGVNAAAVALMAGVTARPDEPGRLAQRPRRSREHLVLVAQANERDLARSRRCGSGPCARVRLRVAWGRPHCPS